MQDGRQAVLDRDRRGLPNPAQQHFVVGALQASGRGRATSGRASFIADHVDDHEELASECGDARGRHLGDFVDVVVSIAIVHRFEDV